MNESATVVAMTTFGAADGNLSSFPDILCSFLQAQTTSNPAFAIYLLREVSHVAESEWLPEFETCRPVSYALLSSY
jgi:hypothetical protein